MTKILKFLLLWLFLIPMNHWKCLKCGKRGCSPMDFPDASTLWRCCRCGEEFWGHDVLTRVASEQVGSRRCAECGERADEHTIIRARGDVGMDHDFAIHPMDYSLKEFDSL